MYEMNRHCAHTEGSFTLPCCAWRTEALRNQMNLPSQCGLMMKAMCFSMVPFTQGQLSCLLTTWT